MKIHIKILAIFFLLLSGCSKVTNETPYFVDYNIHFNILIPPFHTGNMNIKGDKSFEIIYVSPGDTTNKFKALNNTVVGNITDSEMLKLIELCKLADVYKVKFLKDKNGMVILNLDDFVFVLDIKDKDGKTNKLSFSDGYIPEEACNLENYSLTLMNKYYKWR